MAHGGGPWPVFRRGGAFADFSTVVYDLVGELRTWQGGAGAVDGVCACVPH